MEEQHPIPQQISSYQFRLVGDMTLKQFFELAGGALIALLFYASPLHAFIKWPLMFVSFLSGVALAFLPIEDRPLETWIFSFFKSIYSPTLFVWRKNTALGPYFLEEGAQAPTSDLHATVYQAIQEPISAVEKEAVEALTNLESKEEEFLNKVTQHLKIPVSASPQIQQQKPVGPPPLHLVQAEDKKKKAQREDRAKREEVKVAETSPISVEKQKKEVLKEDLQQKEQFSTQQVQKAQPAQEGIEGKQAQFSSEAAPPVPPTKANTIVGQVVAPDGKIVEGAILEIIDEGGTVQRALKSNQLGHFMIVTPLANGKYEIKTEKEGFVFDPVTIDVKGKILPPIAVWANKSKGEEKKKEKTIYQQN
jgi:hypothetical protein